MPSAAWTASLLRLLLAAQGDEREGSRKIEIRDHRQQHQSNDGRDSHQPGKKRRLAVCSALVSGEGDVDAENEAANDVEAHKKIIAGIEQQFDGAVEK